MFDVYKTEAGVQVAIYLMKTTHFSREPAKSFMCLAPDVWTGKSEIVHELGKLDRPLCFISS